MKAWTVSDYNGDYATQIVYAETRGKAKALCFNDDNFGDVEWNELRVRRFKAYDQYYDGKSKPEFWLYDEHRVRLVKDFGWTCHEPLDNWCVDCPAKKWCKGDEE